MIRMTFYKSLLTSIINFLSLEYKIFFTRLHAPDEYVLVDIAKLKPFYNRPIKIDENTRVPHHLREPVSAPEESD